MTEPRLAEETLSLAIFMSKFDKNHSFLGIWEFFPMFMHGHVSRNTEMSM